MQCKVWDSQAIYYEDSQHLSPAARVRQFGYFLRQTRTFFLWALPLIKCYWIELIMIWASGIKHFESALEYAKRFTHRYSSRNTQCPAEMLILLIFRVTFCRRGPWPPYCTVNFFLCSRISVMGELAVTAKIRYKKNR